MIIGKLIGRGRTAEIYDCGENRVLKLFAAKVSVEAIEREYRLSLRAAALGIAAPQVYELLQMNDRWGIVFERIYGPSLTRWALGNPLRIRQAGQILAKLHHSIHMADIVDAEDWPLQQSALAQQIERGDIPAELKEKALAAAAVLPPGNTLCHSDFHPDNVIVSAQGPVVIDWMTATRGHAMVDVARTSIILSAPSLPQDMPMKPVVRAIRSVFHSAYLTHYLSLSKTTAENLTQHFAVVMAARLAEQVPGEREHLLKKLQKYVATP